MRLLPMSLLRAGLLGAAVYLAWPGMSAAETATRWLARAWQTEDGLPNNTIGGLAQTLDGFLWLGTPTGLVRFDGVNFQEVVSTNFVELPNRGVLTLLGGRGSGLCLAMDRGSVVRLNAGKARVYLPERDLPDEFPHTLAEDADGAIWISYRAGTVCRIREDGVTRFTEADGLPVGVNLCALTSDTRGCIWFAKGRQLGLVRAGRFQTLAEIPGPFTQLAASRQGGVWVCSGTRLFRFDEPGGLKDFGEYTPPLPGAGPSAVLEDREGAVWIGTLFSGLVHFDGTTFENVGTSHREITCLTEDREGNVWVGTTGGGLNQVRPQFVALEGVEEGLPFERVQSLTEDTNGVLWAATQNGSLARRIGGRWESFLPERGWSNQVTCVCADPTGAVWLGTRMHALYRWRNDRLAAWDDGRGIAGQTVHTLQASADGELWIGADTPNVVQHWRAGALAALEPGTNDLRVIRAMTRDAHGTLWVGTSRGLLLRQEGNQLVDETRRTTGTATSIRCLAATPDGALWIGYAGWGLGRLHGNRFVMIRAAQGLPDEFISQIVADGRGWLWFGGDRGIFRVRQQELEAVAEGRTARVRAIRHGRGDGLPSLQATFGGAPGAVRSRDGRIWMPMRTALAVINPARIRENVQPPPVLLHRVMVDDRTVARHSGVVPGNGIRRGEVLPLETAGETLRVPPRHRRVQFDFAVLSFTAPENVHFRHRLDGVDEDWVEGGPERSARYSRLGAGDYTFRVIACNSDGVWNETGVVLSVVVLPFFWQTWWFRLGVLATFTGSVILIAHYVSFRRLRRRLERLEHQAALHKERARIAKDIHDDVGANLTQIALLGELARQDHAAATNTVTNRIEKISVTARQAVKSLDEIVWAVNPRNDTLAHLIDYTGQYALDYLRVAGVRCRLDLPELPPEREISTDVRHNLFLVVKEALNNIVKHAGASEVWLRLEATELELRLAVEDNGRGFEIRPEAAGADGLRNMRQRIQDIGGACRIESCAGAGTKVMVHLPWSRAVVRAS